MRRGADGQRRLHDGRTRGSAPPRQRGIALLTVLMVFGLATLVVRDMMLIGLADVQGATALLDSRQAYYYALGGEAYARQLLWQDRDGDLAGGREADGLQDDWNAQGLTFEIDDGHLQIWVADLQGRFNLTNLRSAAGAADPQVVAQLRQLLDAIGIDSALAGRLADWVDEDREPSPGGAEDESYGDGAAPMLAGNAPLADLAEINAIASLTEQQYQGLFAHLTTLPERTKLNINTAGAEVLVAAGGLGEGVARSLHRGQETSTYAGIEQALRAQGVAADGFGERLTTASSWFEIEVLASYRERSARLRSVIYRDPRSGATRVVYRSQRSRLKAG